MAAGMSSAPMCTAFSRDGRTTRSDTGSPPAARPRSQVTSPIISRAMEKKPVRVGLASTPRMRSSPASASSASAARNAADDGSPGMRRSSGGSGASHAPSTARTPSPAASVRTGAPSEDSIRSVWSRESTGSVTETGTRAPAPASSTADLICALAFGET